MQGVETAAWRGVEVKRGAIGHPKLRHLARLLGVPPYAALGLLEALVHWTYAYAPQGDVGRHDDQDIADGIGWDGDATALVAAFVEARWLDRCGTHRLVVHDLADHADRVWQQTLKRKGCDFVRAVPVVAASPDATVKPRRDTVKPPCDTLSTQSVTASAPCDTLKPPTRPDQTKPNQTRSTSLAIARSAALVPVPAALPEFAEVWDAYPNKRGKAEALKVWRRIGTPELARVVVAAVAWQRREAEWLRDQGRFIPRLSTYLNQRRWEDEPSPVAGAFATPQTAGNAQALAEALRAIDRGEVG